MASRYMAIVITSRPLSVSSASIACAAGRFNMPTELASSTASTIAQ
jgi:hypothetical protein